MYDVNTNPRNAKNLTFNLDEHNNLQVERGETTHRITQVNRKLSSLMRATGKSIEVEIEINNQVTQRVSVYKRSFDKRLTQIFSETTNPRDNFGRQIRKLIQTDNNTLRIKDITKRLEIIEKVAASLDVPEKELHPLTNNEILGFVFDNIEIITGQNFSERAAELLSDPIRVIALMDDFAEHPINVTILAKEKLKGEESYQQYLADFRACLEKTPEHSEELLVTEDKLREKLYEGVEAYNAYIGHKRNKYEAVMQQAKVDFEDLLEQYELSIVDGNTTVLHSKEGVDEKHPEITPALLMKIVRKANRALSTSQGQGARTYSKKYLWHIMVSRNTQGNLEVIKWSGRASRDSTLPEYLGEGTYAVIQKVYSLTRGRFEALKIASPIDPDLNQEAIEDTLHEGALLTKLNPDGTAPGMPQVTGVYSINTAGNSLNAYAMGLCNMGSLLDAVKESNLPEVLSEYEILGLAIDILKALKYLQTPMTTEGQERDRILHGDIKLENILIHKNPDGTYKAVLGDLGGAREFKDIPESFNKSNPLQSIFSQLYFSQGDLILLSKEKNTTKRVQLQLKRDLFAAAASIWGLMTGMMPYDSIEKDFYIRNGMNMEIISLIFPNHLEPLNGRKNVKDRFGPEVYLVLKEALDNDPKKRPSIDEMLNVLSLARELMSSSDSSSIG